jgi:uncharacterized membrane protein YeaQ/YmgE (transglycosylase-associated protein family)
VNLALWVCTGALTGLLVGVVIGRAWWKRILLDAVIGIAGAIPLAWFLLPMSGSTDANRVYISGLVGAVVGAAALVATSEIIRP